VRLGADPDAIPTTGTGVCIETDPNHAHPTKQPVEGLEGAEMATPTVLEHQKIEEKDREQDVTSGPSHYPA
jgi:hypothetical protein